MIRPTFTAREMAAFPLIDQPRPYWQDQEGPDAEERRQLYDRMWENQVAKSPARPAPVKPRRFSPSHAVALATGLFLGSVAGFVFALNVVQFL